MSRTADERGQLGERGVNQAHAMQSHMLKGGRSFSGREPHCAFLNTGVSEEAGGIRPFATVSAVTGLDFPDDGRGLALVDWDQDGDLDLWFSNRNAPRLRFLRNDSSVASGWLAVKLVGNGVTSNRDAIGARAEVVSGAAPGGLRTVRGLRAGEGFLSQSSKWLHFGLGDTGGPVALKVRWPDGTVDELDSVGVNQRVTISQASAPQGAAAIVKSEIDGSRVTALSPSRPQARPALSAGRTLLRVRPFLPEASYRTLKGVRRRLPLGEGKPVLINLWATWCKPCLIELADFTEQAEEFRAAGIEVYALAVEGGNDQASTPAAKEKLLERIGFPFVGGLATRRLQEDLEHIRLTLMPFSKKLAVPTSFLIDGEGRLAAVYKGRVSVDTVVADAAVAREAEYSEVKRRAAFVPGRSISDTRVDQVSRENEARLMLQFARHWGKAQQMEAAAKHFVEVQRLAPDMAFPHYGLGAVYLTQGKLELAEEQLRRSLELDPSYEACWFALGNVLANRQDWSGAERAWGRAVELKPDFEQAQQSLNKLRQMRSVR
ncbi:MAG: ASPIC/UnbV domain-containing protein [Planctomycetota bacterium]